MSCKLLPVAADWHDRAMSLAALHGGNVGAQVEHNKTSDVQHYACSDWSGAKGYKHKFDNDCVQLMVSVLALTNETHC